MNVYQRMLQGMGAMGVPMTTGYGAGAGGGVYTDPSGGIWIGAGSGGPTQTVPGKTPGTSAGAAVTGGATRQNITTLQNAIQAAPGCNLSRGVDGVWGSDTRQGTQCLAGTMGGLEALYARYPFVRGLMAGGTSGGSSRSPATQQSSTQTQTQAASILNFSSPWLWAIIAGVLVVGGGVVYYKTRDDDFSVLSDEELERKILERQIEAGVGSVPQTKKQ